MQRALISVSDKTGIVDLARVLATAGVELVSTGGTAATLRDAGLDVVDVAQLTGQPEVMGGRVKTLHPRIHGGLLARRDVPADLAELEQLGGRPIDLVVVNLYPFRATIEQSGVTPEQAIEQVDIGGPTMLRAAAKNHAHVAVVVDPADYPRIGAAIGSDAGIDARERTALAAKAFRHVAAYDAVVAQYLTELGGEPFPEQLTITLDKVQDLRYGENPHQGAAFYADGIGRGSGLAGARQLQGKELSYNNLADADAALAIVAEFDEPAAAIVKHVNPCGVAIGETVLDAWTRAHDADPISAFGGIVACNRIVDAALAAQLAEIFLEVVLAPGYEPAALELLAARENLRVLEVEPATSANASPAGTRSTARSASTVAGGMLLQHQDVHHLERTALQIVTRATPTDEQLDDLLLGWHVVKHVMSNAVVLTSGGATVGIGAGQMNRVGAARIAIEAAGGSVRGSVLASDAFFPMPDSIELAADAGIAAIIQPGGSRRDADVIAACDAAGIAMAFTGIRHFRH
jgi:phosphoribosylaminoimidazolecarboxamide formyltransferase/IMP cyclohydrolase